MCCPGRTLPSRPVLLVALGRREGLLVELQWGKTIRAPGEGGREGEKQTPLLSQMLLKTQGSFCMSNKSRASHTHHLELPVGIQ